MTSALATPALQPALHVKYTGQDPIKATPVMTTIHTPSPPTLPQSQKPNGTTTPSLLARGSVDAGQPEREESPEPSQKKAGLSSRLTRMFSSSGKSSAAVAQKTDGSVAGSISMERGGQSETGTSSEAGTASRANSIRSDGLGSKPPSRTPSHNGGNRDAPVAMERKNSKQLCSTRWQVLPDGSHEHLLRGTKRQEKLSNMLREAFGGKKKDEFEDGNNGNGGNNQQLSLMSSWVDQLKNERDKLASDKKGGPNQTETLVQKYGKCQEIVGRGAFGIVRISHKSNPKSGVEQLYAVKEFRRRPSESPKKYQKRLTSEFCISSSLRHPNVIHTLDLLQDAKGDYCEVMEFCAGGDLYTLVLAAGKLEVAEADCFFKQLMRGVEYMHEMGVAHRDLKPENLLLTNHGALKITDFGNGECFRMAWEKEAHMTAGLCGSAPYIAPEEYLEKEFDPRAVDVWACGVIYMAMRTGRHLWRVAKRDEDEFFENYLTGRKSEDGYAPIETLHRARCRNVIYSILDPNPGRRITASQVLKSEWGRQIKLCKAGEEGY